MQELYQRLGLGIFQGGYRSADADFWNIFGGFPMTSEIKCKICKKEIDINEAVAKKSGGFECKDCKGKWDFIQMVLAIVIGGIMLALGTR